jgi:tetratricopeptide (TPR) repeat protein
MEATQSETPNKTSAGSSSVEAKDRPSSTSAPARSRIGLLFVSLLFVVMATISAGSTYVALRMAEERTRALDDYQQTSKAFEQVVIAVCGNTELKGSKMEPVRQALLKPALEYYEQYLKTHKDVERDLPQVASAQFHVAGLQAKLGQQESVDSLRQGLVYLNALIKSDADADVYPDVQTPILKMAAPSEWLNPKNGGGDFQTRGMGVTLTLVGTVSVLDDAAKKHPQSIGIRDDQAAFLKASSNLMSMAGRSQMKMSLDYWLRARDILEQLVREQPANTDYKARLAESLSSAGRLQKATKDNDAAITSYQRAVEIREQLAAAKPDDKSAQEDLTVAKRELEKLKPAPPAEKDAAQTTQGNPAQPAEKDAAPPAEKDPAQPAPEANPPQG